MEHVHRLEKLDKQRSALSVELAKVKCKIWREKKRRGLPSLAELKALLEYEHESGLFRWRVTRHSFGGKAKTGQIAGTLKPGKAGGYILIGVDQRLYRAHRLAWWFMTGTPAPKGIDVEHRNRDRADNRWENLRLATRSQNNCNTGVRITNTSGFKGVHRVTTTSPGGKPWFARITVNGRKIHLGCFDTVEEAAEARRLADIQYQGEFRPSLKHK